MTFKADNVNERLWCTHYIDKTSNGIVEQRLAWHKHTKGRRRGSVSKQGQEADEEEEEEKKIGGVTSFIRQIYTKNRMANVGIMKSQRMGAPKTAHRPGHATLMTWHSVENSICILCRFHIDLIAIYEIAQALYALLCVNTHIHIC